MKDVFDKEIDQVINRKQEMPSNVRRSIDQSYKIVRARSKKKKKFFIGKRVVAAACALLITGVAITNEHVRAGITSFFHFGDQGIERAVTEGFAQKSNSVAVDHHIKISLKQHFADANKLGMSFELAFEDPTLLKNDVREITLDFRLKNGDGEYIHEHIPDTKPLKGHNSASISGSEHQNPIIDKKTGIVQYDVLVDSNEGKIPSLKNAVVEIESINIFYDGNLKKVDGKWDLPLSNKKNEKVDSTIEYVMVNQPSALHVTSAKASATSLNVTFAVDGLHGKDENKFLGMKIIDEEGKEYDYSGGFRIRESNKQTMISTNFQITSYNKSKKLTLVVGEFGEVELVKK